MTLDCSSRATILVVDDDALIAMNTADMLTSLGHRVIEAHSGREALDIIGREPVDVIVTDYGMPGMTGIELAHQARALRPGLPVLLATGYSEIEGDDEKAFPIVSKPFEEERLGALLSSLLGSKTPA